MEKKEGNTHTKQKNKKKKRKKKTCRDQDSNLGYYGHNVMS